MGGYPNSGEIGFLLEAKIWELPATHSTRDSGQKVDPGPPTSNKRVKELAFKAIDLKDEHSRRRTIQGRQRLPADPAEETSQLRSTADAQGSTSSSNPE